MLFIVLVFIKFGSHFNNCLLTYKARVLQLWFQFQSTKKGDLSIQDYILQMRGITDFLNSTSLVLSDEELLLYILGGLACEYDPVVINLTSRHEFVSLLEAQYILQSQELCIEQQIVSMNLEPHYANVAFKKGGLGDIKEVIISTSNQP